MFLHFMYCPLLSFYTIRQLGTARCNTVLQNCKKNFPTRWNREILHLLSYKPKNSCKNFYFFLFVYLSSARAAYTTITAIKPRTTTFKICVKISAIFSPNQSTNQIAYQTNAGMPAATIAAKVLGNQFSVYGRVMAKTAKQIAAMTSNAIGITPSAV